MSQHAKYKDKILIVGDSRSRLLETLITPPPTHGIDFLFDDEATFNAAKNHVLKKLANGNYICVYLMIGIYSLTSADNRVRYLPFDTAQDAVESITREIKTTMKELDDLHTTPIVLCTFPAAHLLSVNNSKLTSEPTINLQQKQNMLDEAILQINDNIVDLNLTRGYSTPHLAAIVHKCHKKRQDGSKKIRHHYCRLVDGLNPVKSTLLYWSRRLEEDFSQFIFDFDQDK